MDEDSQLRTEAWTPPGKNQIKVKTVADNLFYNVLFYLEDSLTRKGDKSNITVTKLQTYLRTYSHCIP